MHTNGLCYYFGSPNLSDIYCTHITFGNLSVYPCDFIVTSTCYVQFSVPPINSVTCMIQETYKLKVSSILLSIVIVDNSIWLFVDIWWNFIWLHCLFKKVGLILLHKVMFKWLYYLLLIFQWPTPAGLSNERQTTNHQGCFFIQQLNNWLGSSPSMCRGGVDCA